MANPQDSGALTRASAFAQQSHRDRVNAHQRMGATLASAPAQFMAAQRHQQQMQQQAIESQVRIASQRLREQQHAQNVENYRAELALRRERAQTQQMEAQTARIRAETANRDSQTRAEQPPAGANPFQVYEDPDTGQYVSLTRVAGRDGRQSWKYSPVARQDIYRQRAEEERQRERQQAQLKVQREGRLGRAVDVSERRAEIREQGDERKYELQERRLDQQASSETRRGSLAERKFDADQRRARERLENRRAEAEFELRRERQRELDEMKDRHEQAQIQQIGQEIKAIQNEMFKSPEQEKRLEELRGEMNSILQGQRQRIQEREREMKAEELRRKRASFDPADLERRIRNSIDMDAIRKRVKESLRRDR